MNYKSFKTVCYQSKEKIISFSLMLLFFYVFSQIEKYYGDDDILSCIKWFLAYLSLIAFISLFSKFKIFRIIEVIVTVPLAIFIYLMNIIQPLINTFFAYTMIMGGVVFTFILLPEILSIYYLQNTTKYFIALTFTSIIISTFGDWFVEKYHNFKNENKNEIYQRSIEIFDQKKARVLIFVVYFILMLLLNIMSFNGINMFQNDIGNSILQSFATYIAFDRIKSNWKS